MVMQNQYNAVILNLKEMSIKLEPLLRIVCMYVR